MKKNTQYIRNSFLQNVHPKKASTENIQGLCTSVVTPQKENKNVFKMHGCANEDLNRGQYSPTRIGYSNLINYDVFVECFGTCFKKSKYDGDVRNESGYCTKYTTKSLKSPFFYQILNRDAFTGADSTK